MLARTMGLGLLTLAAFLVAIAAGRELGDTTEGTLVDRSRNAAATGPLTGRAALERSINRLADPRKQWRVFVPSPDGSGAVEVEPEHLLRLLVGATRTSRMVAMSVMPPRPDPHAQRGGAELVSSEQVKCMLCEEDGDDHWFWPQTEELCADPEWEPPDWGDCRACGATSGCHADAEPGPCHVECTLNFLAAIAEDVDGLLVDLRCNLGSNKDVAVDLVARRVALTPGLSINPSQKTISLRDCEGKVVGEWRVPPDLRSAVHAGP